MNKAKSNKRRLFNKFEHNLMLDLKKTKIKLMLYKIKLMIYLINTQELKIIIKINKIY